MVEESSMPKWPVSERLMLVSIMDRFGESDWVKTARLCRRYAPQSANLDNFTHKNCAQQYSDLVSELCPSNASRRGRATGELNLKYMISELTRQYVEQLSKAVNKQREDFERCQREIEQCVRGDVTSEQLDEMMKRAIEEDQEDNIPDDDATLTLYRERLAKYRGNGGFWDTELSEPEEAEVDKNENPGTPSKPRPMRTTSESVSDKQSDVNISPSTRTKRPTPRKSAALEVGRSPTKASSAGTPERSPTKRRGRPPLNPTVEDSSLSKKLRQESVELDSISVVSDRSSIGASTSSTHSPKIKPEPRDSDAGSSVAESDPKMWKHKILLAWRLISGHRHANVFAQPVTEGMAKGYKHTVKLPMDLSTLKRHVEHGQITNTIEFKRSLSLMFANAVMFNSTGHEVFELAREMAAESTHMVEETLSMDDQTAAGETAKLRRSEGMSRRSLRGRDS